MNYLFDYGEALLCFVPVFFIIAAIGAALLWNAIPARKVEKAEKADDENGPQ